MDLYSKIKSLQKDINLPSDSDLQELLQKVNKILENENTHEYAKGENSLDIQEENLFEPTIYRPLNKKKSPGGLLDFSDEITTIMVPDLHARVDFIPTLLDFEIDAYQDNQLKKLSVYEALTQGLVRVICLGDGLHAERRAKDRWQQAYDDIFYLEKERSPALDEEMAEGLTTMAMVMECKCAFPYYFHFLKGNHENITNCSEHGNMPFSKFAYEGQMCYQFMKSNYSVPTVASYARFEKLLPVFVRGKNYLCSHAEPIREFSLKEIQDAALKPEVIYGLTWTGNDDSAPGTVENMLSSYLEKDDGFYFAGHRPVFSEKYNLRASGKFVQIHNPEEMNVALIQPNKNFNPDEDIKSII